MPLPSYTMVLRMLYQQCQPFTSLSLVASRKAWVEGVLGVQLAAGTYHAGGALYEKPGEGGHMELGRVLPEDLIKVLLTFDTHMAMECSVNYVDRVNSYVVRHDNGEQVKKVWEIQKYCFYTFLSSTFNMLDCCKGLPKLILCVPVQVT
jgi:hypothetical protein